MRTQPLSTWLPPTFEHRHLDEYSERCAGCQHQPFSIAEESLSAGMEPFVLDDAGAFITQLPGMIPKALWRSLYVTGDSCESSSFIRRFDHTPVSVAAVTLPSGIGLEVRVTFDSYTYQRGLTKGARHNNDISIWERSGAEARLLGHHSRYATSAALAYGNFRSAGHIDSAETKNAYAERRLLAGFVRVLGVEYDNEEAINMIEDYDYLGLNKNSPEVLIARAVHQNRER